MFKEEQYMLNVFNSSFNRFVTFSNSAEGSAHKEFKNINFYTNYEGEFINKIIEHAYFQIL